MQSDLYSIVRRHNRQRAWLRLLWRKRIPALLAFVQVRYYRVKATYIRRRNERLKAKEIERVRQALAVSVIDPNRQCPACGAKDGRIQFSDTHGKVLHMCNVCKAVCAEPPIFRYADWKVEFVSEVPESLNIIEAAMRKAEEKVNSRTQ